MDDDSILIIGIDRIASAISENIGRHRVVKMIKEHKMPAYQLENKGPWMISRKALVKWIEDFNIPPERV